MSHSSATKCDAAGCREKHTEEQNLPKGWTRAVITTRSKTYEIDFCEKHSGPIHEAVAQTFDKSG